MIATEVRDEIEQELRQWEDAFNRGDMAALAALYAEDGVLMPPDTDLIRGRQGIQDFWRSARDGGIRRIRLEMQDVQASGDLAVEVSYATLTIQPDGGQPNDVRVKYVVGWRRLGSGRWELMVDIWNTTAPA